MKLKLVTGEGPVARVACEGKLTEELGTYPENPLGPLLGPDGYRRTVLLDLGRTDYVDSSGISWLIVAHKQFTAAGGRLVVHSATGPVESVFGLLRLPEVLNVAADEQTALALAEGRT
jgi:anti-anti-sigma factor